LLAACRDPPAGRQAKSTSPYDFWGASRPVLASAWCPCWGIAPHHREWATCVSSLLHVPAGTRCDVRRGPTSTRNHSDQNSHHTETIEKAPEDLDRKIAGALGAQA